MMKKTKTATIAIATALTTLLSAGAVFANTTSTETVKTPNVCESQTNEIHTWFKSRVDSLVSSGSLYETQGSSMISMIGSAKGGFDKGNHFGQVKNILDDLVAAGTITQAQKEAIQSGIKLKVEATPAVEASPAVEAKAAVEAQPAVEAKAAVEASAAVEAKPAVEATPAVEASPAVEAKPAVEAVPAVEASHSVDINIVMDGLVTEGVITQAQEEAIQDQLMQLREHKNNHSVKQEK